MGTGQLWAVARQAASEDMGRAVAAGDAISALIKNVRPFLNSGTWSGPAADAWMGEWNGFYGRLVRMLNELPAAQTAVLKTVDSEMEAAQRRGLPVRCRAAAR